MERELGLVAELSREGEYWTIAFADHELRVRDSKGMGYLAELLAHPGREIEALALTAAVSANPMSVSEVAEAGLAVGGDADSGPLLDAQARGAYRARLEELQAEIEEAERFHDPERVSARRLEYEALIDELSAATGLGGRERRAGSVAERARLNVTRAIKSAIGRVAEHDPVLGQHLSACVQTGRVCSYRARSGPEVSWTVSSRTRSRPSGGLRSARDRAGDARADEDPAGGRIPAQRPAPARRISVVIADDQELVRTGFRAILESELDITVVGEAADGRSAVDLVERQRPDVVLMDIRMPELNGLQAAERIVSDPELRTAVLMLTTFDASEYVYQALRIGVSGFLLKDAPADRLLDAIRVIAAGDALLAPSITRRLIEQFTHACRTPPGEPPDALRELTPSELDVLRLVARGLSNAEIAEELGAPEPVIKSGVGGILSKLGLRDRVQAVVRAYETGLVSRSEPGGERPSPG